MHLPVPKAGLIGLSAIFALVAALAVFIYSSGVNEAEAATYAPTGSVKFCNAISATFPDTKPYTDADLAGNPACVEGAIPASTARNITTTFQVAGGNSNFGSAVITNVPGTVATDAAIPNGQKVGALQSDVTLALLNGPCTTALQAEFVLYDSATTGAAITPNSPATANRWGAAPTPIVDDAAPSPPGSTALDEVADSDSPFVTSNLSIYETLFTPAGGAYIAPQARYTGASRVPAGGDWQLLSFFQVSGAALNAFAINATDEPHIFGRASRTGSTGNFSLSILNDPTATAIAISPIHDFCAPLVVNTMLLGTTPGGQTRYTTPAASTAGISFFSYGQRDADNDGFENAYDTCPLNANTGVDSDSDGIDNACDPGAPAGTDADGDGYANRQDNCPLVSNNPNTDSEGNPATSYLAAAPDGGPKGDSVGDACDPNPGTSSTEGAAVENYYGPIYKCIGGVDADGDGICTGQDINDASVCAVGAAGCGFASNAGMDSEYKNNSGSQGDHGDGQGGNHEVYLGTSPLLKCGIVGAPNAWSDTWPYDLAKTNSVNIADVTALKPFFGTAVPPTNARYDLTPSKTINIADVTALKPMFGKSCTP